MSAGDSLCFPTLKILFLLIIFLNLNNTPINSSCPPSSCGHITQIRYPFRLRTDSQSSCKRYNSPYFDLDCSSSNDTYFTTNSRRYYVDGIDYGTRTIRLVDPGIKWGNLSSCPLYSLGHLDWSTQHFSLYFNISSPYFVAFIHCLSPVNSTKYVRAPFCGHRSNIFANISREFYMVGGEMLLISELEESCAVDMVTLISSSAANAPKKGNSSSSSIPSSIYGEYFGDGQLELSWHAAPTICAARGHHGIYGLSTSEQVGCQLVRYLYVVLTRVFVSPVGIFRYIGYFNGYTILKFVIGFPLLVWLVVHKWRRRHLSMDKTIEEFLQNQHNFAPIKYTYSEIKKMTNDFSQKLGEGGYGIVYKGKLRSGPFVAIKMMEQSVATEEEFISEVVTIGQIHHVNIVQLIGFCVERSKCALVYEFLPNGSLDRYIFNQQSLGMDALTYEKMFEIALGVARGIEYMHHGCNMQILHFDIKPHNILLDEKFNPKISDFGLARLRQTEESMSLMIPARGTVGYMAPEMFYRNMGGISFKVDVYSYGMMLMEIASRRKNTNPFVEDTTSQMYFPLWAYEQLWSGNDDDMEIMEATEEEEERKIVKKMIVVALWCIQIRPSDRPTMKKVLEMLENNCTEPQIPPKPFVAPQEIAAAGGHEGIPTRSYNVNCMSTLELFDT